jgi:predicted phage baseplate assembly protein
MALKPSNLDNLTFQQIVDHAKKLIPRYCPEWTDHNVSDPGVTLIELFASMTEMLLYRVNQVPDNMYITFLNLIGIRLQEARAAQAPVTFYLSTYNLQEAA